MNNRLARNCCYQQYFVDGSLPKKIKGRTWFWLASSGRCRSRRLRWPSGDRVGKKPQSEKPLRSGGVVKNLCSFSTKVNVRRVVKVFDRSSLAANFLLLVLGRASVAVCWPGRLLHVVFLCPRSLPLSLSLPFPRALFVIAAPLPCPGILLPRC